MGALESAEDHIRKAEGRTGQGLPFTMEEYVARLERVREAMVRQGIDLLYLTAPESLYYLSGYQAEWYQAQSPEVWPPLSGLAVHNDHDNFILFDTEEEARMIQGTTISTDTRLFETVDLDVMLKTIRKSLAGEGWLGGVVGLEMRSYRPNRVVSEQLQAELERGGCRVVDATHLLRTLRGTKSPPELDCVQEAGRIADIGMRAAIDHMRTGMTELDVYAEVISAMARAGGENPGIPIPVLSGERSAWPHALASRKVIGPGEIVCIDICGVYQRYHANLARTFVMGEPDPRVAHMVDTSAGIVERARELISPNLPVSRFNATMKASYRKAGIWARRIWVGGYELGIAFPPDWVGEFVYDPEREAGEARFHPGTVVNYESNYYLPDGSGSIIIDTFVFDPSCAKALSEIRPGLIVVN